MDVGTDQIRQPSKQDKHPRRTSLALRTSQTPCEQLPHDPPGARLASAPSQNENITRLLSSLDTYLLRGSSSDAVPLTQLTETWILQPRPASPLRTPSDHGAPLAERPAPRRRPAGPSAAAEQHARAHVAGPAAIAAADVHDRSAAARSD